MKLFVVVCIMASDSFGGPSVETVVEYFKTKGEVIRYLVSELEFERYDSPGSKDKFYNLDIMNGKEFLIIDIENEKNIDLTDFLNFYEFLEEFDPDNHYREGAKESIVIKFNQYKCS